MHKYHSKAVGGSWIPDPQAPTEVVQAVPVKENLASKNKNKLN